MAKVWFGIPKVITLDRNGIEEEAIQIEEGFGNNPNVNMLGVDGGLTLTEAEDLAWRLKQGTHLLRTGKELHQRI